MNNIPPITLPTAKTYKMNAEEYRVFLWQQIFDMRRQGISSLYLEHNSAVIAIAFRYGLPTRQFIAEIPETLGEIDAFCDQYDVPEIDRQCIRAAYMLVHPECQKVRRDQL